MRIVNLFEDGFECNKIDSKEFIARPYKIRDNFFLKKDLNYSDGIIEITLENISADEIVEDFYSKGYIQVYGVINEIIGGCVYLKKYESKASLFKRVFVYEGRGFVTIPFSEELNQFEAGDILKETIMWW